MPKVQEEVAGQHFESRPQPQPQELGRTAASASAGAPASFAAISSTPTLSSMLSQPFPSIPQRSSALSQAPAMLKHSLSSSSSSPALSTSTIAFQEPKSIGIGSTAGLHGQGVGAGAGAGAIVKSGYEALEKENMQGGWRDSVRPMAASRQSSADSASVKLASSRTGLANIANGTMHSSRSSLSSSTFTSSSSSRRSLLQPTPSFPPPPLAPVVVELDRPTPILKRGSLRKLQRTGDHWVTHKVEVHEYAITVYKPARQQSAEKRSAVTTVPFTSVSAISLSNDFGGPAHAFQVVCSDGSTSKTHVFGCQSREELDQWLQVLKLQLRKTFGFAGVATR
eukprot:CAMPEP_0184667304 /NCGR_PEP_ID=MMETSP0308-20130426/66560_1 /TAXON_ID=38269 /ORGANISM="Gloeochaete witrockiana, Strain SAG 46.84" /LENGTH=337 /DNA_ID=CAMNT_0027112425 /DNA_START=48 /DNA_END=1061 /DNA_ORIENTATION=-